ncbi:hypothetical protein Trydic_g6672 [Trypoxylus dichotomus]
MLRGGAISTGLSPSTMGENEIVSGSAQYAHLDVVEIWNVNGGRERTKKLNAAAKIGRALSVGNRHRDQQHYRHQRTPLERLSGVRHWGKKRRIEEGTMPEVAVWGLGDYEAIELKIDEPFNRGPRTHRSIDLSL